MDEFGKNFPRRKYVIEKMLMKRWKNFERE